MNLDQEQNKQKYIDLVNQRTQLLLDLNKLELDTKAYMDLDCYIDSVEDELIGLGWPHLDVE